MENERLTRTYRINEEVFIFEMSPSDELPVIIKGRVVGVLSENTIFKFRFQILSNGNLYFRHPIAIFKTLDEIRDCFNDMIIE